MKRQTLSVIYKIIVSIVASSLLLTTSFLFLHHLSKADVGLVYEANFGSGPAYRPNHLTVFSNALYFEFDDGIHGEELWKYEGVTASLVADIYPGATGSTIGVILVFSNAIYLNAMDSTGDHHLWKYDGITITKIVNPLGGAVSSEFGIANNTLFFPVNASGIGSELWEYDGVTMTLVADNNPGIGHTHLNSLTEFRNELYFRADVGIQGWQLWKYDGITLSQVTNFAIQTSGPVVGFFTVYSDTLFFGAHDGNTGRELWKYDGVTFTLVADINPGIANSMFVGEMRFVVFSDTLFFGANDGNTGDELWKYDGVTVTQIANINAGSSSSFPLVYAGENGVGGGVFSDTLYFSADDGSTGQELWKYDGISVTLVADLKSGGSSYPNGFEVFDEALYFVADNSRGYELLKLAEIPPPPPPKKTHLPIILKN